MVYDDYDDLISVILPFFLYSVWWHLKLWFVCTFPFSEGSGFIFFLYKFTIGILSPPNYLLSCDHIQCMYILGCFAVLTCLLFDGLKDHSTCILGSNHSRSFLPLYLNLQHFCCKKCKFPMSYICSIVCFLISLVVVCI